nr:primase C-terminal domain-containing protein [Pseudonocardia sp. ICBG1293]
MPGRAWHNQRRRTPIGYSRNETLFHSVRHYAYREMRHHFGDPDSYRAAITREVAIRNADFGTPLGHTELGHISRSITDWTINHSKMWNDGPTAYNTTFSAIQAARGRKGGRKGGLARGIARASASRQLHAAVEVAAF